MARILKRKLFFLWWRLVAWRYRNQEPPDFLTLTMMHPQYIKKSIRFLRSQEKTENENG